MLKKGSVLVLIVTFWAGSVFGAGFTLKIGSVLSDKDPIIVGLNSLSKNVSKRTKKLEVQVFPSSQLGDTKDIQEMIRSGANLGVVTDAGRLAEMIPEIGIMAAPYIVNSFEEAEKLVKSKLWKGFEEKLASQHGIRVLSFNWYQGARHLLTNKPVKKPADLKGIRMRTPGSPIWQNTIRAMGASPTALSWSEVYPGLQQGVIDGAEAQHPATVGAHLYEVIKYITKTGHFQLVTALIVSEQWFKTLPADAKKILLDEAFKAGHHASNLTISKLAAYEEEMKKEGVTINTVNKTPFIEATEVVYKDLKLDGLRKQVKAVLK